MTLKMWAYYSCGIVLALITLGGLINTSHIPPLEDPGRLIGSVVVTFWVGYGSWWLLSHAEAIRIKGCEA
jgi:bacteriorhodopsin